MTFVLGTLIRDASTTLGSAACSVGRHDWESEGGRSCPKGCDGCSQTVYRCRTCGSYDYGERGGPANRDCDPCTRTPAEDYNE